MTHSSHAVKFNCIQISNLLDVLEKHGIEPNLSDAEASQMFSELLVTSARELDSEQADAFHNAV